MHLFDDPEVYHYTHRHAHTHSTTVDNSHSDKPHFINKSQSTKHKRKNVVKHSSESHCQTGNPRPSGLHKLTVLFNKTYMYKRLWPDQINCVRRNMKSNNLLLIKGPQARSEYPITLEVHGNTQLGKRRWNWIDWQTSPIHTNYSNIAKTLLTNSQLKVHRQEVSTRAPQISIATGSDKSVHLRQSNWINWHDSSNTH